MEVEVEVDMADDVTPEVAAPEVETFVDAEPDDDEVVDTGELEEDDVAAEPDVYVEEEVVKAIVEETTDEDEVNGVPENDVEEVVVEEVVVAVTLAAGTDAAPCWYSCSR